jgi:hypothetical protein
MWPRKFGFTYVIGLLKEIRKMALIDAMWEFSAAQAVSGTSAVISTNVHDQGSAKKAFVGHQNGKISLKVYTPTGTNPTFLGEYVAADDDALTSNVVVLGSTGTTAVLTALNTPMVFELVPQYQETAKRYYGMRYTLTGTTPAVVVDAALVQSGQTHMIK